jgi:hypothetical protein
MKYRVNGEVTISVSVVVDAATPEQARKLALRAPMQTLCGSCSRGEDDEWSTSGELDGDVTIQQNGVEEA